MAGKTPKKPVGDEAEPQVLEEPHGGEEALGLDDDDMVEEPEMRDIWLRGLWMLLFALFFRLAEVILAVATVLQFLWLLFGKAKNAPIAAFGEDLADWMARTTRFQTGVSDERPFPFAKWGKEE